MENNTQTPLAPASNAPSDSLTREWFRIDDIPEDSVRSVGDVTRVEKMQQADAR